MSLDTVLKIGKALRNAPDNLRHFKYVEACPKDKDGNYPYCISIPVNEDFTIDWDNVKEVPENERENLFYLKFKTSDSDSSAKKYVFGDIYFKREAQFDNKGRFKKLIEYGGVYTVEKGNAFKNSEKARKKIEEVFCDDLIKQYLTDQDKLELKKELVVAIRKGADYKPAKKHASNIELIQNLSNKVTTCINAVHLKKFWRLFETNQERIEKLLRFAPAFQTCVNGSKRFCELFSDEDELLQYYIRGLFENHSKMLKNFINKDEKPESISQESLNKIKENGYSEIFIHWDFNGSNWFDFKDAFDQITGYLNSEISSKTEKGIVLTKSVYRTLCSGDLKNDWQFPGFRLNNSPHSFAFSDEKFHDFLYSDSFVKVPRYRLKGTPIAIYVLPSSLKNHQDVNAQDYLDFLNYKNEGAFLNSEPLFPFDDHEIPMSITGFDFIFSDTSGKTIVDLIELSGLDRSSFFYIEKEIEKNEKCINSELSNSLNRKIGFYFSIEKALSLLTGEFIENEKNETIEINTKYRYKAHVLKILPKIYSGSYSYDERLLPCFIENIELLMRANESSVLWINSKSDNQAAFGVTQYWQKYQVLKNAFKLFKLLQKTDIMDIINSQSYQLGNSLGILAKNFAGANSPIKSFEKNYVGNLSRRISNLSDFIKLKNDIEQKLIMHEKTNFTYQTSYALAQKVKEFTGAYNKEECAFGFFESYFKPISKQDNKENEPNNQDN